MTLPLILSLLLCATPSPHQAAIDEVKLASGVDELVAQWDTPESPGGAICVLSGGKPVLLKAFGMADLGQDRPVTLETPFYIASVAKSLTAFCVTHAALEGRLKLDAPLRESFPELPALYSQVTLRQAMHHTSGILDVYDVLIAADLPFDAVASNADAIELMSRLPGLNFRPGSRFLYSNSGYVLLAEAVQRATGMDLASYAREHLFGPFAMDQAHFLGQGEAKNDASSYRQAANGWTRRDVQTGLRGPGGLYASILDLMQFDRGLGQGVDSELGGALIEPSPGSTDPRFGAYTAGWMLLEFRGLSAQRHHGGAFGFSADMLRFPEEDTTVIVLTNASDLSATDLSEAIAELVLGDRMGPELSMPADAVTLSAEETARFGRLWRSPATDECWILTPKGPGFVIASLGDMKLKLVPVSESRLQAVDAQVPFSAELEGQELVIRIEDQECARLTQLPFPPRDLAPASDYAGEYASDDLETTILLKAAPGGRLKLQQDDPLIDLPPFMALGPDLYFCDRGARIDFHRDEGGAVTGLTMHANRAWGLGFVRIE